MKTALMFYCTRHAEHLIRISRYLEKREDTGNEVDTKSLTKLYMKSGAYKRQSMYAKRRQKYCSGRWESSRQCKHDWQPRPQGLLSFFQDGVWWRLVRVFDQTPSWKKRKKALGTRLHDWRTRSSVIEQLRKQSCSDWLIIYLMHDVFWNLVHTRQYGVDLVFFRDSLQKLRRSFYMGSPHGLL